MQVNEAALKALRECQEHKIPVILNANGIDVVYQTLIVAIDQQYVAIKNKIPPAHIARVMQSTSFGLQAKMYRFTSEQVRSDGENVVFPFAQLNQLEETRQSERFPFHSDERVVCELLNPLDQRTRLIKPVLDMSATGASIRSARPSKLFQPGRTFLDLRIIIDGQLYKRTSATIVHTRQMIDLNNRLRVQVGLKFNETSQSSSAGEA